MKRKRALLLTITVLLVVCAACGVWLHVQRQQDDRSRALIDALKKSDFQTALALVNAGAAPNLRDKQRRMPLQKAQQANDPDLVRLMKGGAGREGVPSTPALLPAPLLRR